MNSNIEQSYSTVYFYVRYGFWRTLQNYCQQEFKRYQDPFFIFWKAFGLYKEGYNSEAINELMIIQSKREIQFATFSALIYYHQNSKMIDRDALDEYKRNKEDQRKNASDKAVMLASYFYLYVEELKQAQSVLESINQKNININTSKAWLEFFFQTPISIKNAFQIFDDNLDEQKNGNSKHLESLIGKAKTSEYQKKFNISIDIINEVIVYFPNFLAAQVEKSLLLMKIGDWEQSLEIANEVLKIEQNEITALKIVLFHVLAREGNIQEFLYKFEQLIAIIDQYEPQNTQLMLDLSRLFSRISGRNEKILKLTMKLLNKCRQLNPLDGSNALELAIQHVMLQEYQQGYNFFQEAASLDETQIGALSGMIHCRIMQGMTDDAEKQIEFVNEIQSQEGRSSDIAYLEALLTARKNQHNLENMKFIDEALKLHISVTKQLTAGFEFYIKLDPNFLMSLAQEYLQFVSMDHVMKETIIPNSSYIIKGNKLLETITKQIPGLIPSHLLLAKGKLAIGDTSAALKSIEQCLQMDPQNEEAAILQALIQIRSNNIKGANNSLAQAISNNFKIRENPLFMLVKGDIELKQCDYENALTTLETAYNLPCIQNGINGGVILSKTGSTNILTFSENDRCKVFLLLAKTYALNKKFNEAKSIMNKAIMEWTGTPVEVSVLIANSEISVEMGDIKKALSILRAVTTDSSYYQDSRKLMGEIFLNNLKDRRHFAQCYLDMAENQPCFENYKQLGDAFLRIQEPEDALNAYEKAMTFANDKNKGSDKNIVRDIGKCLQMTHNYQKAIQYYENALAQNKGKAELILDLGQLYLKINNLKRAEELLRPEQFSDEFQAVTIETLKMNVQAFLSIYKLHLKKQGIYNYQSNDFARKALEKVLIIQSDLVEKCKSDGGNIEAEKINLANYFIDYANYLRKYERNDQKALQSTEKALKYINDPVVESNILQMQADLLYKLGDKEGCEQKCLKIMKLNPNNEYSSSMISELLIQKDESSKALSQFQKLLEERHDNYGILSKMIQFLKRQGALEEANEYLQKAEKNASNINDPGLAFCRGLYNKFMRMPQEALKEFNKSKRNQGYFEESIEHMIDIYLNPQQELYYSMSDENSYLKSVDQENLKAADSLLNELKNSQIKDLLKLQILQAYIILYNKNVKNQYETVINIASDTIAQNQDYVPGLLLLSVGKFFAKKQNDAKVHLKHICQSIPYSTEYADHIEKACLLYADTFIAANKNDVAEQILKQCLKFNQSCGKAEEFLGMIKEKEQNFKEAAFHYEAAFKLTNQKSAAIGYRLAYNYLRAKRYVEAIDVSKKVLELYPDYPKIEKEILQKARGCLRMPAQN